MRSYVLITPAHNEAQFIDRIFHSICSQTVPPLRWVIVNDGSSDETSVILERCLSQRPEMIELVHLHRPQGRDFGNKVRAFKAGMARVEGLDYAFIGNLDADISLQSDYYEQILREFDRDPILGVAGGMVATCVDGKFISQNVSLDSVAGAVQLFRRACFAEIGGYLELPNGGIDAAAEIMARMNGWRVCTFPDLCVLEHRCTGTATASPLSARVKEGRRMYSLGYGFVFFLLRCVRRSTARPRLLGSMAALYGYLGALASRDAVRLPPAVVTYLREEQRGKLRGMLRYIFASMGRL